MKKVFALGVIVVLFCLVFGCNPRVVQCNKCGATAGVRGGTLPGQGSRCPCGGRVHKVRDLTQADWQKVKERGYVTLSDGEPADAPVWTPNYDRAER